MSGEWLTIQAALAFGGFKDAEETEIATAWAAGEIERLRGGLALIVKEAEQFPDADGIGAGTMARNLLAGAGR
jgi:hypothetical protein